MHVLLLEYLVGAVSFACVRVGQWSISLQCFQSLSFDVLFFRGSVNVGCILVMFVYACCGHFHGSLLAMIAFGSFLAAREQTVIELW